VTAKTDMLAAADAIPEVDLLEEISRVTAYRDRLIERHWQGIDKPGTWPRHCEQRAFCDGAAWWAWANGHGETMGSDDNARCEREAIKRYGVPREDSQTD
jgi:hypothetical protein